MTTEYLDKAGATLLVQKTKAELAKKVDKVSGKELSTNDYTTAEKNKLAGIASGAQVNAITTVKVNGTALTPDASKANQNLAAYKRQRISDCVTSKFCNQCCGW